MRMNRHAPLFTIALLLGGCGESGGALGDSPVVSGQIASWTLGTGWTMQVDISGASTSAPVTGPIDGAGSFSVTLPGSATLGSSLGAANEFPNPCPSSVGSGQVDASPSTVRGAAATFTALKDTGCGDVSAAPVTLGVTTPDNSYSLGVSYVYFDEDATASGTLPCGGITSTVDVSVSKGWNTLLILDAPHQGWYETSLPPPAAATWTAALCSQGD
jgi:hypothetical protein